MAKELETVFHNVEVVIPGDAKTAYARLCNALTSIETVEQKVGWGTSQFTERDADSSDTTRTGRTDDLWDE